MTTVVSRTIVLDTTRMPIRATLVTRVCRPTLLAGATIIAAMPVVSMAAVAAPLMTVAPMSASEKVGGKERPLLERLDS